MPEPPSLLQSYLAANPPSGAPAPAAPKPTREMTNVYDEAGNPLGIEDVGQALSAGKARFDAAQDYAVLDPGGTARVIKGDQVYNALSQGWQLESNEAREVRKLRAQSGFTDDLAATGLGALESLTFGTAPAIAEIVGGQGAAKAWRRKVEASPEARTVGEVLGFLTPMGVEAAATRGLTRGATGAILEGATAAPRALSRVARGAGELAVSRLPEATTALGRALQRGAKLGVEGAVEGAVYGGGYAFGEAALGDKELTAERFLAAMGSGALLGAGIGGGLGVGSAAISKAAEGIDLTGFAERQAWKATGATGALTRKVGLDQAKRSGRRMLDEGLLKFESFEERAAALRKATDEAGSDIGKLIERIDETGARPSVAPILERFDEQLGKLREGVGADVRLAKKLDRDFGDWMRDRVTPGAEPTFKELHSMRARVDDYLEKAKGQRDTILIGEYGKLRGAIEDEIKRQADSMAERLGDDFLGQYSAAKSRYRDLVNAAKVAEYRAPMLEAGNRSLSLTDNIMAGAGLVSAGPGGLALAGANKALREYGDTAAALFADKLGRRGAKRTPTLAEVMSGQRAANDVVAPAPTTLDERLAAGEVPPANWIFNRETMIPGRSDRLAQAYSGPANPNDIATGRVNPPGSATPLDPIQLITHEGQVMLRDGRHRLEQALANGATEIRATVQTAEEAAEAFGQEGAREVIIPLDGPRRTQLQPTPEETKAKLEALGYVKNKADKIALQLSKDVTDAVKNPSHAIAARGASGAGAYEALAADAREHRVAPDRSATKIAARVAPLMESAPELGLAVTVKATGDLDYLAKQLPSAAVSGAAVAQSKAVQPSGSERAGFERKARAIQEPQSAVFDMQKGRLSDDALAAIKERRPLLLYKIQEEADRAYADLVRQGKVPDRQTRLQLEKLLDRKIDPASSPTVVRIVQRAYQQQAQMTAPPPVTPSKINRAERMMSQSEEIARGDI